MQFFATTSRSSRLRGVLLLCYPARPMPVTRERVDPVKDQSDLGLVHRRWILPDDVQRPVTLPQQARLWRGLIELGCLDGGQEVRLERLRGGAREELDMPAAASAGALLAGAGASSLVTQVVWL